ncbi:MAG: hypothetical protein U9R79_09555 [Armatimonadota bacterium]|nr:hypothetical protein [Armatimonadota bacterium]
MVRDRVVADLATQLWRMRKRMLDADTGGPREEVRGEYRALEAAWDALSEAGVDIRDYTGKRMPQTGSYTVSVLAFEPTPGVTHEVITETVKPSVYFDGERIQMAEVVVATPEDSEETAQEQ